MAPASRAAPSSPEALIVFGSWPLRAIPASAGQHPAAIVQGLSRHRLAIPAGRFLLDVDRRGEARIANPAQHLGNGTVSLAKCHNRTKILLLVLQMNVPDAP